MYVWVCVCVCVFVCARARACMDRVSLLLMQILVMNWYGDHKTSLLHSGMCMYLF